MQKVNSSDIQKYTLGTWQFGGAMERNPDNDDESDIQTIKMHLDNGVIQIFTAQNYAEGWAEKLVGQAIKDYDRKNLLLSTAIRKEHSSYDDMLRSMEESLNRMGLDYIDIVVHHAPIPEVPISESIKALNAIVDKGLARGLAVSNYNSSSMKEALRTTNHPILFNQVYYNLFIREVEQDGVLKLCQENNVLIQAFRPLELGKFENNNAPILAGLAKKYSLTNSQLALSWLTSQQGVVVVATTHKKEHLQQNLKAVETKIEDKDIERLRNEFPIKTLDKNWIR
jgi:diketogulonate reductase-like aldo/keto reductase